MWKNFVWILFFCQCLCAPWLSFSWSFGDTKFPSHIKNISLVHYAHLWREISQSLLSHVISSISNFTCRLSAVHQPEHIIAVTCSMENFLCLEECSLTLIHSLMAVVMSFTSSTLRQRTGTNQSQVEHHPAPNQGILTSAFYYFCQYFYLAKFCWGHRAWHNVMFTPRWRGELWE